MWEIPKLWQTFNHNHLETVTLTQYHFLDESGDPGLSSLEKSSSHFVLALVQLSEHAPLPELTTVRQTLHLAPTFEFKYHKMKPLQKAAFFKSIQPVSFRVRAVVIDKSRVEKRLAGMRGQDIMVEFIARLALRASGLDIANDVLVIDGATRAFIRALRLKLSEECGQSGRVRPFKKIVKGDSRRDDGLQLADMIAGAVRQYALAVERDHYQTFLSKVVDLWEVPEQGK